jgi:hypothetical protein
MNKYSLEQCQNLNQQQEAAWKTKKQKLFYHYL